MMFFLLAVWLLAIPNSSVLWSCERDNRPIFTNRPAISDSAPCRPELLERAPFTRVPAEYFSRYTDLMVDGIPEFRDQLSSHEGSKRVKSSTTSWRSEELAPDVGGLAPNCRLWGKAKGGEPGPATVSILRGGATIDELPIGLKERGETPWEILLRGKCRSPKVSVKSVSNK